MTVSLVGAGPGDPELITVKGLDRIRRCQLLVHDRLVAPELVAAAPRAAERVPRDGLTQAELNRLLVREGRHRHVVRLKGGDPLLFGRGGEEALALVAADVPFEIVPGVSSLAAVPAAALIPVTHRGTANTVTAFAANDPANLDTPALARLPGTLVGFMGAATLAELAKRLILDSKPADTPAAVISQGTTDEQQVATGTLATISRLAAHLPTPALIVIGEVVALREQLLQHARTIAA